LYSLREGRGGEGRGGEGSGVVIVLDKKTHKKNKLDSNKNEAYSFIVTI